MTFAFLHGEIPVAWNVMGALAEVAVVVIVLSWCWRPPRSPKLPTAGYLLLALLGYELWVSHSSNLLISSAGFALTLPWSSLPFFDIPIPTWTILPGIILNAVLLYLVAGSMSRYRRNAHDAG